MTSNTAKSLQDAEAQYNKAAQAELNGSFNQAFRLYLEAAKSFIELGRIYSSKGSDGENSRYKLGAKKCLDRAEKIKTAKKDLLVPIARDPFTEDEQKSVIQRSSIVYDIRYDLWEDAQALANDTGVAIRTTLKSSGTQPDLGPSLSAQSPRWLRPLEAFGDSGMTVASVALEPNQILQNVISDCSLCSSVAVCLLHHRGFASKLCLSSLFPQDADGMPQMAVNGHYAVRVYFNGAFRRIFIDDYLPFYSDGRPICMSTSPKFDLWPGLIEKAYLKLCGGYDFPGSNSSIDIHVLTGWIPEHIDIKRDVEFEQERAWTRILRGFKDGSCVVTVGTGRRNASDLVIDGVRLLPSHSYAVVHVEEEHDVRWLTILNPPVSNGAVEASSTVEEEAERRMSLMDLHEQPDHLRIRLQDVRSVFDGLYLNWNPALFSHSLEFHGTWKMKSTDVTHPQCVHHRLRIDPIGANPGDELWILLTRHFTNKRRDNEYIAIHAQQEDVLRDSNTTAEATLNGSYTSSTHTLTRLILDKPVGHVTLFASYDGDYEDVFFTAFVYCSSKLAWIREPPKHTYTQMFEGTLTSKNSGGNSTYPTFMNNPQYHLHLQQPNNTGAKVEVRLIVDGPRDVPLNLMLVYAAGGERISSVMQGGGVANSGSYGYGVAQAVGSVKPGDYTIIISAFEPRYRGSYSLRVESSAKMDVTAIPMEGSGMFCKSIRGCWEPGRDGGSANFGRYEVNPKYEIEIRSSTPVKARLQVTNSSTSQALNIAIFSANPDHSRGRQITSSGAYVDTVAGVVTPQVTVGPGKYIVVCSTYDPGMHAEFVVLLYSKMADLGVVNL